MPTDRHRLTTGLGDHNEGCRLQQPDDQTDYRQKKENVTYLTSPNPFFPQTLFPIRIPFKSRTALQFGRILWWRYTLGVYERILWTSRTRWDANFATYYAPASNHHYRGKGARLQRTRVTRPYVGCATVVPVGTDDGVLQARILNRLRHWRRTCPRRLQDVCPSM